VTLQEQIRSNRLRSLIIVFGFVVLLVALAGLIGIALDYSIGIFALVFAGVYGLFALLQSRSIVARLTHAKEVPSSELRPVRRLLENASIAAGLPVTPELRLVDDQAPNAFAAGLRPERSFVGVTTGLLETMPKRELEAVIAHEVAHIRHRDTYLMTVAVVFAGVIAVIADIGFRALAFGGGRGRRGGALVLVLALVGFILAPIAALLLRMSLSRRREFLADAGAAEILNDPEAMALALQRLRLDQTTLRYSEVSVAHLWVESPSDRIETERSSVSALSGLFNTHPPLEARIAALEEAGGFRLPEQLPADEPFAVELRQ
jgi:heat shock protein HtpX